MGVKRSSPLGYINYWEIPKYARNRDQLRSEAQLMRFRLVRLMARGTQVNRFMKGLKSLFPALSVSIIFCSLSVIFCLISLISRIGLCAYTPGVSVQEIKNTSDRQKPGISPDFPLKEIQAAGIPLSPIPLSFSSLFCPIFFSRRSQQRNMRRKRFPLMPWHLHQPRKDNALLPITFGISVTRPQSRQGVK